MYRQSNIDIELGLQVGMNIGVGILHDVLSPGFAFKRSNPKLIDALKEIERRVNETLRPPGAPRGQRNGNFKTGNWTIEALEERKWLRSLVRSFANCMRTK
jgi:hypothetical protein